MRVALYGRVSKDDGKQDTENQLHELREFCRRSNWYVEQEYVDRASGKTMDRPQFKLLFEDAAKRKSTWFCSGRLIASRAKVSGKH